MRHVALRTIGIVVAIAPAPLVVCGDTRGEVEFECPLCTTKFKAIVAFSGTQFGTRLDLRPVGAIASPWPVPVCTHCGFALFKDGKTEKLTDEEREALRQIVARDDYKAIKKTDPSYLRIARLYEALDRPALDVAFAYLRASWQVEADDSACAAHLQKCLDALAKHRESASKDDPQTPTIEFLYGEILRRLKRFDDARAHFERLSADEKFAADPFPMLLDLERKLIDAKNSAPSEVPRRERPKDEALKPKT